MSALFDPYAALAKTEISAGTPANSANSANLNPSEGQKLAELAELAGPKDENRKNHPPATTGARADKSDMRHGFTIGGRPLTYTGRVVSLEDWRNLSDWEKHGPDGRIWNGKTQEWEMPK